MIPNDARCVHPITSRVAMKKASFNKKILFASKLGSNLRKKLATFYICVVPLYGAKTWTLREVDQKYLESFEMWCWRRMGKINWIDHVENEEVLMNILRTIKWKKATILHRHCLLKHVIEGKIEERIDVTVRRGRRRNQLLDNL
jgi:hypothetical protein